MYFKMTAIILTEIKTLQEIPETIFFTPEKYVMNSYQFKSKNR